MGMFGLRKIIGSVAVDLTGNVAGGDLSGSYPNPTVAKLQGTSVSTTTPTNNQLLQYISADGKWEPQTVTAVSVTTKGDLQGYSTVPARIPVGSDTQVLTADSTQPLGVKWAAGGGSSSLSGLTIATATNTIDNTNYAQVWNWSTATTQTPLTITGNAITTGSLLSLTSSYAAGNSTNGLLYVANTSAVTNGIIARIASNSTAGSGLTVLASGNVGIGTTGPGTRLDVLAESNFSQIVEIRSSSSTPGMRFGPYWSAYSYRSTIQSNSNAGFGIAVAGGGDFVITEVYDREAFRIKGGLGAALSRIGIGGVTSPTNTLSFQGDFARTIWMERHTTANTAGNNLTLQSGGATVGATDKAGGNLLLSSGTSTGTGGSEIQFWTAPVQLTGTADNAPTQKMVIDKAGNVGIGTTAPTNLLSLGGNAARIFWMERGTVANTAGYSLTVQSGGATSGATDKNGGQLILQPGLSTGTGIGSIALKRLTRAGSTGTSDNTLVDAHIIAAEKTITAGGSVDLFEVALPAGGMCGGLVQFQITATDGTELQVHSGAVTYAAVNKGGVYTSQITDMGAAADSNAGSAGATTDTWAITSGTNKITISTTIACSSITANLIKIYYSVFNGGVNAITQL